MTVIKQYRIGGGAPQGGGSPFGFIGGIIMLALTLIIGYVILKGVFNLLFWLSPILLIAGIAVDPSGALKTGKSILTLAKKNPLIPIGIVIICALGFPLIPGVLMALTGGFLLAKYSVKKKIKKVFNQHGPQPPEEEEFVEYEEVVEDDFLKLPPLEPKVESNSNPKKDSTNEYDNMF